MEREPAINYIKIIITEAKANLKDATEYDARHGLSNYIRGLEKALHILNTEELK